MKPRVIYEVCVINSTPHIKADDMIVFRNFYRNKRLALQTEKQLSKRYPGYVTYIRKLHKSEHKYVII